MLIGLVRDSVLQCFCHSCKAPLGVVGEWVLVARGPLPLSIFPRWDLPSDFSVKRVGCSAFNTRSRTVFENHFPMLFFMTLNNRFSITNSRLLKDERNVEFVFPKFLEERTRISYTCGRFRHWFDTELYRGGALQRQSLMRNPYKRFSNCFNISRMYDLLFLWKVISYSQRNQSLCSNYWIIYFFLYKIDNSCKIIRWFFSEVPNLVDAELFTKQSWNNLTSIEPNLLRFLLRYL